MASYSDFWGAYTLLINRSSLQRAATRLFRRMKKDRELALTLNGAAAGAAALYTEKRVAHSITELGQIRPIETNSYVDRVTVAADETELDEILSVDSKIALATDKAGDFPA